MTRPLGTCRVGRRSTLSEPQRIRTPGPGQFRKIRYDQPSQHRSTNILRGNRRCESSRHAWGRRQDWRYARTLSKSPKNPELLFAIETSPSRRVEGSCRSHQFRSAFGRVGRSRYRSGRSHDRAGPDGLAFTSRAHIAKVGSGMMARCAMPSGVLPGLHYYPLIDGAPRRPRSYTNMAEELARAGGDGRALRLLARARMVDPVTTDRDERVHGVDDNRPRQGSLVMNPGSCPVSRTRLDARASACPAGGPADAATPWSALSKALATNRFASAIPLFRAGLM